MLVAVNSMSFIRVYPFAILTRKLIHGNSGFAAYHPWVSAQGFPFEEVDHGLRWGAANLTKAGFNVHGASPKKWFFCAI